jgi:hypothetical protein
MMEIDFERMQRVRESVRGIGRTFTAAWDAIEHLENNLKSELVWNIPDVKWADHILERCIIPICNYKGLGFYLERVKGRLQVTIVGQGAEQYIGTIWFSHYKDTAYDFRGRHYKTVEDYGELAMHLGWRVLSENR